ncbi:MAG: hypothetical protein WBE90_15660 [Xanthobacteraceae bacterium]
MTLRKKNPGRGGTRHGAGYATSKARISRPPTNTKRVDFEAINRAALPVLPILLARWLPSGRRVGLEYVALNPTRADQHLGSFKIAVSGPRAGKWADFATGDNGGDAISLAAYLFGLSQVGAARKIAIMLGIAS